MHYGHLYKVRIIAVQIRFLSGPWSVSFFPYFFFIEDSCLVQPFRPSWRDDEMSPLQFLFQIPQHLSTTSFSNKFLRLISPHLYFPVSI